MERHHHYLTNPTAVPSPLESRPHQDGVPTGIPPPLESHLLWNAVPTGVPSPLDCRPHWNAVPTAVPSQRQCRSHWNPVPTATGKNWALGGPAAEEETQDGGCGSQNIVKFSEAGPIRSLKQDTQPELGHIMQLCLGRARSARALSYLSKGDSYGN